MPGSSNIASIIFNQMRVIDDCTNRRREDNNTSRLNLASTLNFAQSIIWSAMAIHQEVLGEVGKGGSSRKLKEGERAVESRLTSIDIGLIVKKGSCLHQKLSIKFAFLIQITNFTICYLILQRSNSKFLSPFASSLDNFSIEFLGRPFLQLAACFICMQIMA